MTTQVIRVANQPPSIDTSKSDVSIFNGSLNNNFTT